MDIFSWKKPGPGIRTVVITAIIIIAFFAGFIMRGKPAGVNKEGGSTARIVAAVKFWTCSMHPQIKQPGPGKCPICAMDLIPVSENSGDKALGPTQIKLSEYAIKLAEIQTVPVERKFVNSEIRMDGRVEYDETRIFHITAWVPGRIEKLFVDYTGVKVEKSDHMVSLYSPELVNAQQELILGLKMMKAGPQSLRRSTLRNVQATREKLRLWGLTAEQIGKIEKTGKITDRTTIYSPISGVVVEKTGFEGMYVKVGTRIYTVADLTSVWVKLDAYESDLVWIRYGQKVQFTTKSCPGELFSGHITFVDPILNPKTRTVKLRVNIANPDGKLKPGMFVSAEVFSRVASEGRVIDPSMAGKWVCPMHPSVIKDKKGVCSICGMALVAVESLGYKIASNKLKQPPLVIPATAPLITGKRAVVYVSVPGRGGVFEGRQITLGPRAGSYYIVKAGLKEGEQVVANGNFKIDSAVQILAKPSMMSPEGGGAPAGHAGMKMKNMDSGKN